MASDDTATRPAFDPVTDGWKVLRTQPINHVTGPIYARREGESWAYAMLAQQQHLNANNALHGGIQMAFADHAVGMVAWEAANRAQCVTIQLNSLFVRGARAGDFVECRARVVRTTSALIFMTGELSVSGDTILQVDGIWRKLGSR